MSTIIGWWCILSNYKDKDWLFEKYVIKELASEEIANICGVSSQTILNWMKKFGIPARSNVVRSARTKKKLHKNICRNCGDEFFVDMPCKADPTNKKKFVRCCSKECLSNLRSNLMKSYRYKGIFDEHHANQVGVLRRKLDKNVLVEMYNYKHMLLDDIAKELKVKRTILTREMERLEIKQEFFRECPKCGKSYSCPIRSMVDPNSNKFKKFCSRKCFLSSRNQCDTWIELELKQAFESNGIDYKEQVPIKRMTIDFQIEGTKTLIEANGDFWHANPKIYGEDKPLHKIQKKAVAKDERKQKVLKELGYTVITIWENDLKTNKEKTISNLIQQINHL